MAVKVNILSVEYRNKLFHGDDFLTAGTTATHVLAPVDTEGQVKFKVRISNQFTLNRYDVTGGDTITLSPGQSFLTEGFYEGGSANLVFINGNNYTFDIDTISADGREMIVSNVQQIDDSGTPIGASSLPNGPYSDGEDLDVMRAISESNGLIARTAFVPNNEEPSFISDLDQKVQAYKFDGLRPGGAPGPVITGVWDNIIKGSNTGAMTCQFIQDITDNGVNKTATAGACPLATIQEFEIVQEFIVGPAYQTGEFSNVDTEEAPDRLEQGLKQIFELRFSSTLSNPNNLQTGQINHVLGKTPYFGSNYTDDEQQYSVTNVTYTDQITGDPLTKILASSTTRVTCSINSANSTFNIGDTVILNHSYLPGGDQYANQKDVYKDVWLYEGLRQLVDDPAANGTILTNFTATFVSAAQIDLQFDVVFSAAQQAKLQNDYNYKLSIEVADSALDLLVSDWSNMVIDANQYEINTDVPGLMSFDQSYFYTAPMSYPVGSPFSNVRAWVQDQVLYDWGFSLDRTKDAVLESLTLRLVAYNTVTNNFFEFDSVAYDLSGQVITGTSPTIQNIEVDTTRGWKLADGDKLNWVKMQTGTYSAPNMPYTGQTAFRVSWQEWLKLPGADTVFYNPAEPNNGLNKKASNYSLLNNYVIAVIIDARINNGQRTTQYIQRSATMEIYDFGQQDGSPITWTPTMQVFDLSGNDLNGNIPTDQNCILKATYVPDTPVLDASIYWGEVRIEPVNNTGNNYDVLSTIYSPPVDNKLIGPSGGPLATLTLDSGNVILQAEVDHTKLTGENMVPSWRMGAIDQSIPVVPVVKRQIDGNTRQREGDWFVFQMPELMSNTSIKPLFFSLDEAVTPGTPPGWQFKISPTAAEPMGDAYVKSNWSAISEVDAASAEGTLNAATSLLWVYCEADDTAKIDEGLLFEYEKAKSGQDPTSLVANIPVGSLDTDKVFYFENNITINSLTSAGASDLYVEVRQDTAAVEDWTAFQRLDVLTLPGLQALIDAIPDGNKWALHVALIHENIEGAAITLNFDYNTGADKEGALSVSQNDVNVAYRQDINQCVNWDPQSSSKYAITAAGDTALLSKLDYTNAITVVGWFEARTFGESTANYPILTPPQAGLSNSDGGGFGFYARNDGSRLSINVAGQTSGATVRKTVFWEIQSVTGVRFGGDHKYMVVFTYNGANTDALVDNNAYLNGVRLPDSVKTLFAGHDDPLTPPIEPSGGLYWHGKLQSSEGNSNKTALVEIYDGVMTAENIRKLYDDPFAGRNAVVPNLFRSWYFGASTGATIPESQASQDMTMNTSISPSNFY